MNSSCRTTPPPKFLVAYGELDIGMSLVLGLLVRPVSICGSIYMLKLLFSANYPGPDAPLWQYFGASLDHSILALCFTTFATSSVGKTFTVQPWISKLRRRGK